MFKNLNSVFLLDGATGTELQKRGMERGVCPEKWVLEHPAAIQEIQRAYAAAGSMAVYAPTFGANRASLKSHGFNADVRSLCRDLVAISRDAVPGSVLVAGDLAPTGLQLMPYGTADFEELVDIYTEQAAALEEAGVDFFAVETQMSIPEARAALIAVKSVSAKPAIVSFSCGDSGRSVMGSDLVSGLLCMQELGADAYGINCCGDLKLMEKLLNRMRGYSGIPLIAKPNAGKPELIDGEARYRMTPAGFADEALGLVQSGAALIGGCCGTCDAHIAALAGAVADVHPYTPAPSAVSVAASQTRVAEIDGDTEIVPVEINDDILESMAEAMGEGAELIRLHIRDENDIETVDENQYGLSLPLSVSFADAVLREKFLRVYHGKAVEE
ncbi:MAG: homocysteine S-methyltransferase family protein [Candidatus Heteroscillospira sp.]|jgi:5-methyltetrahydrofolate--homocysteine methyltransferase